MLVLPFPLDYLNAPVARESRRASAASALGVLGVLLSTLAVGQSTPQCGAFNYCLGASCVFTSIQQACTAAANSAHPAALIHIDTDAQNGQASWSCTYSYTTTTGTGVDSAGGAAQAIQSSCSSDPPANTPPFSLPHCTPSASSYCVLLPLTPAS